MAIAIAIGALVASVVPLYAMWVTLRQRSGADYQNQQAGEIKHLEEKIARKDEQLERCRERYSELMDENLRLMRRLLANGSGAK